MTSFIDVIMVILIVCLVIVNLGRLILFLEKLVGHEEIPDLIDILFDGISSISVGVIIYYIVSFHPNKVYNDNY